MIDISHISTTDSGASGCVIDIKDKCLVIS